MKNSLKYKFSVWSAKSCSAFIKLLGMGAATNLPGKVARKIAPDILSFLVNQTKENIITITGTNGKTTTAGFIANILEKNDFAVAHNRKGANMLSGIITTLAQKSDFNACLNADNTVLEVDEAYFLKAVDEFNPDFLLVTNLFRDQLDRYGELDTTAKKINEAISKTITKKKLTVLLNADDPMVSRLANFDSVKKLFYGFESINLAGQNNNIETPQEVVNCECGLRYEYTKQFYGHLGHYTCSCGKQRSDPSIRAVANIDTNSSTILINIPGKGELTLNVKMPGLYNAYNALAAFLTALELGIKPQKIIYSIENYCTVFGRAELIKIKEKEVLIQLIKNPIGATEVIRTVKDSKNSKLLIIINDNYADGRDVSWLWDANFELLTGFNGDIMVSGTRAWDMATRLKYSGISSTNILVEENIESSLKILLNNTLKSQKLYILPTYTALLQLQPIIKKL